MDEVSLTDLELTEFWRGDDEDREIATNFPFIPSFPTIAGLGAENHTAVYGGLEPGTALATLKTQVTPRWFPHVTDRREFTILKNVYDIQ